MSGQESGLHEVYVKEKEPWTINYGLQVLI